jgi:hypothetical protein
MRRSGMMPASTRSPRSWQSDFPTRKPGGGAAAIKMKGNKLIDVESRGVGAVAGQDGKWWTPWLAGPVIGAAVVRLALLVTVLARAGTHLLVHADTKSYLDPGRNLLLHGRFIADGMPDLLRTPGYPLFLAVTSLAGLSGAAVANVLLSIFSVLLIWKLGRAVFGDNRIALGAAWIFAFEPIAITHSVLLLSEPLFLTLLLLSLERLAEFLRGRRLSVLVAAGLWLAGATFVRPITYYLSVALAVGLFIVLARVPSLPPQRDGRIAGGPGLRWKAPVVLLISVLPWLAAWQLRNWVETGYKGFTSRTSVNLYFFAAADVTSRVEHRPLVDVYQEYGYVCIRDCDEQAYLYPPYLARNPEQAGWNQAQRLAFMHAEAVRIIREHFGVYLRGCLTNLSRTLFRFGTGTFDSLLYPGDPRVEGSTINEELAGGWGAFVKAYPWLAAEKVFFGAVMLGLYLFAARGIFRALRGVLRDGTQNTGVWLLLGTSLYFLAILALAGSVAAEPRYRLPVTPVICIFAAAGWLRPADTNQKTASAQSSA